MMCYFLLSGSHRTLPYSELRAVAEAEGLELKVIAELDQVVIGECDPRIFKALRRRAVLIKSGGPLIGISETSEGVEGVIKAIRDSRICDYGGFSHLSFRRVKGFGRWVKYKELVTRVISSGKEFCRDLSAPALEAVVTEGVVVIGLKEFERDISGLRARDPMRRPYYRPGTLTPEISRIFVNLSRVREGEVLLDPFCGVGSILLEACDLGVKTVGSDISLGSVEGAARNLKRYGCLDCVVAADVCKLPYIRASGVATDPPYGRLTKTGGRSLGELMRCFLDSVKEVLLEGRYLVFAQRIDVDVEDAVKSAGFEIVERHLNWVHGALTRDIFVVKSK